MNTEITPQSAFIYTAEIEVNGRTYLQKKMRTIPDNLRPGTYFELTPDEIVKVESREFNQRKGTFTINYITNSGQARHKTFKDNSLVWMVWIA